MTLRLIALAAFVAAIVSSPGRAAARPTPFWLGDLAMVGRLQSAEGAAMTGAAIGGLVRPSLRTCLHVAADLGFALGKEKIPGEDVELRVLGASLGPLWARGDDDLFFGAGPLVGLHFGSIGSSGDRRTGFVLDAALRATLRARLRRSFWVMADLRLGYTAVDLRYTLAGASVSALDGPLLDLRIGMAFGPSPRQPASDSDAQAARRPASAGRERSEAMASARD